MRLTKVYSSDDSVYAEYLCNGEIKVKKLGDAPADGGGADWNQNDPAKPGYVKNRPFYTGETVCAEAVFAEEITDDGYPMLPEATYELGKVYTIEVNGKELNLEFIDGGNVSSFGKHVVGFNVKATSQGAAYVDRTLPMLKGVPYFQEEELSSGAVSCRLEFSTLDYEVSFPATVKVKTSQVHKLSPKYLPEYTLTITDYDDGSYTIKLNGQILSTEEWVEVLKAKPVFNFTTVGTNDIGEECYIRRVDALIMSGTVEGVTLYVISFDKIDGFIQIDEAAYNAIKSAWSLP